MKRLVSFFFIVLTTSFLFAVDFHVTVLDSEIEIPLEGVVLTLSNKTAGTWETDFNGECIVSIDNFEPPVILQAYLPGYATQKIRLTQDQTDVVINLSIEEIMEGKELVVEKEAYQKADSEAGISVALTKDQVQSTALIGAFPDVMSTVKTLPGVGYAGAFCQQPSIRGSYPYETACVLDGMYVMQPYHWSGTVSIFDPLMVDSVKLSHGIFSAQYGHATAALLDVNSIEPLGENVKINASISSVQTDIFAQIPITPKIGVVAGLRMTYMNTLPWLYDGLGITKLVTDGEIDSISKYIRMPYLYDYYVKGFYKPFERLSFNLNAFLGMEGLGAKFNNGTPEKERYIPVFNETHKYKTYYSKSGTDLDAKWLNIFGFGALNVKWLPTDKLQFVFSGSTNIYNNHLNALFDMRNDIDDSYETYNFTKDIDELYYEKELWGYVFEWNNTYLTTLFQGKASSVYQYDDTNLFSVGVEEFYQRKVLSSDLKAYSEVLSDCHFESEPSSVTDEITPAFDLNYEKTIPGNDIANTVAYALWNYGNDKTPLKGELGLRFEHYYIFRESTLAGQNRNFVTNPYFNPRATIQWTPIRYKNAIDKLTFSAGTGIFTKMLDDVMDLDEAYDINKKNIKPDRNVFALFGSQIDFLENMSFQIEAYYKEYLERYYSVSTPLDDAPVWLGKNKNTTKAAYSNGRGHVAGFDCMLHKKNGRYFDGYICYSFVWARYLNPTGRIEPIYETDQYGDKILKNIPVLYTEANDPVGIWYYPYYHRFHTIMLVLNYRPTAASTWTFSGGITSGNPKNSSVMGLYTSNNVEKQKKQSRNPPVFPLNIRYAVHNYFPHSKVQWELFIGLENALGWMNKTSLIGMVNSEEEIDVSNIANFDTGIPTFSIGYKFSY